MCRRSRVTAYGPFPYQVDGDYLGETEHLEFRWEDAALTLIMPAGSKAAGPPIGPTGEQPNLDGGQVALDTHFCVFPRKMLAAVSSALYAFRYT